MKEKQQARQFRLLFIMKTNIQKITAILPIHTVPVMQIIRLHKNTASGIIVAEDVLPEEKHFAEQPQVQWQKKFFLSLE